MSWEPPKSTTCPDCGQGPLCRDATVYWDDDEKKWELSGSAGDYIFCGNCSAEFKDGEGMEPKKQLVIFYDPEPPNPRTEHDNLGRMALFHRRYTLGDKDIPFRSEDFDCWESMREHIEKELKAVVCLPVYLYDHSGLTISTSPFYSPWDSGQVGFIYVTPAQAKEYGIEPSAEGLENLLNGLLGAVEEYDCYLRGECFGFRVMKRVHGKDDEWEEEESCWGFLGEKWAKEGIAEHSGFSMADVEKAFDNIQYS